MNAICAIAYTEAWKIQDFNRVWTPDLAIPVRRSNQLSYDATDISYITSHSFVTGSLEPTNGQLPTSVASQLSWLERRTGIGRSRVETPLQSWIFQASMYAIA